MPSCFFSVLYSTSMPLGSLLLLVLWCSALTTAAVKLLGNIRGKLAIGDADA